MTTDIYTPTVKTDHQEKEALSLFPREMFSAFIFLITLSLVGLKFPVAYLLLPVVLFSSFLRNRYDFLIQFTILCGSYDFFSEDESFPVQVDGHSPLTVGRHHRHIPPRQNAEQATTPHRRILCPAICPGTYQ